MFAVVIVGMEITNDVKWGVTTDRRTRGKTRLRAPSQHHVTITEGNTPLQRLVLQQKHKFIQSLYRLNYADL